VCGSNESDEIKQRSSKLIHKLLVELCDSANPLGTRSKESGSEMKCSLLLTESTTSDDADTSGVKKSQAVVFIRLSTLLLGLFDGLCREGDCGEEVHGSGG